MTSSLSANSAWLPVAFRDTALTVATIGWDVSPDALRPRCREQIKRLRAELHDAGQPEDVIEDAVYAQCALLDEVALSHLKAHDRDRWEREPLQVTEFGTHDAGDMLIDRMQRRLQQPQPVWPLLAIFHSVLALGFRGRFALEGMEARAAVIQALVERLGVPDQLSPGVVVRSPARRRWLARLSLPACVLLALIATGAVWVLLDRWLGGMTAQLLH